MNKDFSSSYLNTEGDKPMLLQITSGILSQTQ